MGRNVGLFFEMFLLVRLIALPLETRCVIRNIIASSLAGRPLPCASICLGKAARKKVASGGNHFSFGACHPRTALIVSTIKCGRCIQLVRPTGSSGFGVTLSPTACTLSRIIIGPGHRQCGGGSGPTIRFMHGVVRRQSSCSPSRHSF